MNCIKNCHELTVIIVLFFIRNLACGYYVDVPKIGPSGVRALPVAAGTNEGGHYFGPSCAVQTVSKQP